MVFFAMNREITGISQFIAVNERAPLL